MLKEIDIRSYFGLDRQKEVNLFCQIVENVFKINIDKEFLNRSEIEFVKVKLMPKGDKFKFIADRNGLSISGYIEFDFDLFFSVDEHEKKVLILESFMKSIKATDHKYFTENLHYFEEAYQKTLKSNFCWEETVTEVVESPNENFQAILFYKYIEGFIRLFLIVNNNEKSISKVELLRMSAVGYYLTQIRGEIRWINNAVINVSKICRNNLTLRYDIEKELLTYSGVRKDVWFEVNEVAIEDDNPSSAK